MKKYSLMIAGFAIWISIINSSCRKEINKSNDPPVFNTGNSGNHTQSQEKRINIATVAELYAAVNDADNAGSRIILAPGTYVLDASYPNGGRLELQTGMTLQGKPGQPSAVLIDESSLPGSSFITASASTGGVRMGRGTNSLEWLTVKGGAASAAPFAVIATDLLSAETTVRFSNVIILGNGSRIGLDIRNRLVEHAGRKIFAYLENSEITGLTSSFGFGLAVFNVNSATGAAIRLTMRENYIHANKIGLISNNGAFNRTQENSTVEIISYADRLDGNGCALDPTGGGNQSATTFANNNITTISMFGSSLSHNNPPGHPELQPVNGALPGAVYAVAGFNSVNAATGFNRANNNSMKMEFNGCEITDNNGTDIYAFGAWCPPACILAGSGNLLEIWLRGNSAAATVDAVNSSPAEPAGTNVVNVYRN